MRSFCWVAFVGLLVQAATSPVMAEGPYGASWERAGKDFDQENFVAGIVLDSRTLNPIPGAQVSIEGTDRGMVTTNAGRFRIGGVTGTEVTLRIVMLGYRPQTVTVRVGDPNVRVMMEETAIELDELVVTGVPGDTRKRAVGNAVSSVDAASTVASAPIPQVEDLLTGRAPGVAILTGTGMVGSGSKIRIRGASTFSLSQNPLVYIDGVRVDNAANSGMYAQSFGSGVISRLNDINPEEIESIEVLKGPAAATLYGTEATRGVISILTKRGAPGAPRLNLTIRQGVNWLPEASSLFPVNYWRDGDGEVHSLNLVDYQNEQGTPIFRTGHMRNYTASLAGGSANTRYYLSTGWTSDEGALPTNWLEKFTARANLEANPTDNFRFSVSTGYVKGSIQLDCEGGCGGVVWGVAYSTPRNLPEIRCEESPGYGCDFWGGFRNGAPSRFYSYETYQNTDRFTGSMNFTYNPFEWFTNRLTVGVDVSNEQNLNYRVYQTNDTIRYFLGDRRANGFRFQARWGRFLATYDYAGTAEFDVTPGIRSATSLGVQYYTRRTEVIRARGDEFAGPGLSTISATATQPLADDNFTDNNTLGTYLQETFSWRDRMFLTGAVRVDNNSAFGEDVQWVTYPKASLSWVVGEEDWFRDRVAPSLVNAFRLRLAYGHSGEQPQSFVALKTYSPITGPQGSAAVTPSTVGNPDLAPERGEEFEAGFDLGMFDDRIGLQFSYYHKLTRDAILLRPNPPSLGFPGSRYVNAGRILNEGIEAQLRAQVLSGRTVRWDLGVNVATNRGEIQQLSGEVGDNTIVFGIFGSMENRIGYAPNSWFWQRVVSAEWDPVTEQPANVMCDDGNGGTMPCYDAENNVIAPRVYLGRAIPPVELAFTSGLTLFDRVQLNGMLDVRLGHKRFDNTTRIRCKLYRVCYDNVYPEEADPALLAQYRSNDRLLDYAIADAGFARLREVSLAYTFPDDLAQRFGVGGATVRVAGRNLLTFTDWTGLDPEAMFIYGSRAFAEQNNMPQLARFETSLRVSF